MITHADWARAWAITHPEKSAAEFKAECAARGIAKPTAHVYWTRYIMPTRGGTPQPTSPQHSAPVPQPPILPTPSGPIPPPSWFPDPEDDPRGVLKAVAVALVNKQLIPASANALIKIAQTFLAQHAQEQSANEAPGSRALLAMGWQWAHQYTPEQMRVIRASCDHSVILRTPRGTLGKSTINSDTAAYLLASGARKNIHFFCGKEKTAENNVTKVFWHLVRNGFTKRDFLSCSRTSLILQDGRQLTAHANTVPDINSARGDLLWFDEANLISSSIFQTALPLLVGQGQIPHVWFSGNALEDIGDPFNDVCNAFAKRMAGLTLDPQEEERIKAFEQIAGVEFFQFERAVNEWESADEQRALDILLEWFGGSRAVATQMSNTLVGREGALYSQELLAETFVPPHPDPSGLARECSVRILAIDWGTVHDSSFLLVGLRDGKAEEIAHWVGSVSQATDTEWVSVLTSWDTLYNITHVFPENSANAHAYMIPKVAGLFRGRCTPVLFGQGAYDKGQCLGAVQTLMGQGKLRLRSRVLEKQCRSLTYPDLTKKYLPDDAHDTLLYAARTLLLHHWKALGYSYRPAVPTTSIGVGAE